MSNLLCTQSESERTAAFLLRAPSLIVLAVGAGLPYGFLFADLLREDKVNRCKSFHVKRQIAHASTS